MHVWIHIDNTPNGAAHKIMDVVMSGADVTALFVHVYEEFVDIYMYNTYLYLYR